MSRARAVRRQASAQVEPSALPLVSVGEDVPLIEAPAPSLASVPVAARASARAAWTASDRTALFDIVTQLRDLETERGRLLAERDVVVSRLRDAGESWVTLASFCGVTRQALTKRG